MCLQHSDIGILYARESLQRLSNPDFAPAESRYIEAAKNIIDRLGGRTIWNSQQQIVWDLREVLTGSVWSQRRSVACATGWIKKHSKPVLICHGPL